MKQDRSFKRSRNVVYSCKDHIIFYPKYRRSVLVNGVDKRLAEIMMDVGPEFQVEVLELEVYPDHVHLLCEIGPQLGVHRFVKQIKGRSLSLLRDEVAESPPDLVDTRVFRGKRWCSANERHQTVYREPTIRTSYEEGNVLTFCDGIAPGSHPGAIMAR